MRFYRLVPYFVKELPAGVNGRQPSQWAPFFYLSSRVTGAEAERVKLHEWLHVVLSYALAAPFILAYLEAVLSGSAEWPALAMTSLPFAVIALKKFWPDWLLVEWEALPKGAEVASGGDLEAEARGLALSRSYQHGKPVSYCRRRIAFWAGVFG